MHIFSLFDGISCGQLALQRAKIPIETYYASEIDKSAITITQQRFPNTIQLGDIRDISYQVDTSNQLCFMSSQGKYPIETIDMVIGGSPCTDFSQIGLQRGLSTTEYEEITTLEQYLSLKNQNVIFVGQSFLFWEYVRILQEVKPKYFLLENVRMPQKWQDLISETLGVSPLPINSRLLSAQNRPRLYWTNIPNVTMPKDKGIKLDDILDPLADNTDVCYTKTVRKALPILSDKYGKIPSRFNAYNVSRIGDKARTLTAGGSMITSTCATLLFQPTKNGIHEIKNGIMDGEYPVEVSDGRYNIRKLSVLEMERLQTLQEGYTKVMGVTDNQRRHAIGNGWTVDVITHIFSFLP